MKDKNRVPDTEDFACRGQNELGLLFKKKGHVNKRKTGINCGFKDTEDVAGHVKRFSFYFKGKSLTVLNRERSLIFIFSQSL